MMQGNSPDEEHDDPHGQCRHEIKRLQTAIEQARAQLHAVHSVQQVPFLKGAINAALQALEDVRRI